MQSATCMLGIEKGGLRRPLAAGEEALSSEEKCSRPCRFHVLSNWIPARKSTAKRPFLGFSGQSAMADIPKTSNRSTSLVLQPPPPGTPRPAVASSPSRTDPSGESELSDWTRSRRTSATKHPGKIVVYATNIYIYIYMVPPPQKKKKKQYIYIYIYVIIR